MYFDRRLWELTRGLRGRIVATIIIGLLASLIGISRFVLLGLLIAGVFQGAPLASLVPLALAALVLVAVPLGVPQLRHRILGKAGLSSATSHRSTLVSSGADLALHHALIGVGTGGFRNAYDRETHKGRAASHDAPITIAAETGLPGLALLGWLLVVAFTVPFRGNRGLTPTGRALIAFGLALLAIVVHSLFYNALIEDPLFWGLLALSAVALREPARR